MHFIIIFTAILIVAAGVFYNGRDLFLGPESVDKHTNEEVLSMSESDDPSPTSSSSPEQTKSPLPTQGPATKSPSPSQNVSGSFFYPGSTVKSHEGSVSIMISNDDVDVVTNWYKDKIKSLGMNVTSFVVTKTNGNVLNKLAGASSTSKVEVEIRKVATNTEVTITVKE